MFFPPISVGAQDNCYLGTDPTDGMSQNNFDWTEEEFNWYSPVVPTGDILDNPFFHDNNPNTLKFFNSFPKDYAYSDGWRLIKKSFGGLGNTEQDPFLILYNKYTSLLRVFVINASNKNDYSGFAVRIRFVDPNQQRAILEALNGRSFSFPLDEFSINVESRSLSQISTKDKFWYYADFQLYYDPCSCDDIYTLQLTTELIPPEATLQFSTEGTITQDVSNLNSTGPNLNIAAVNGILGSGNTYAKNVNTATMTIIDLFNGTNSFSLCPAFLESAIPGLGFVAGATNALSTLLSPQSPPTPMIFDVQTQSSGTISFEPVPGANVHIALPDGTDGPGGAYAGTYNKHFGIFNMLTRPTVYYTEYLVQENGGPGGELNFRPARAYQLDKRSIEYVVNLSIINYQRPGPTGRNPLQIYGALEFEYGSAFAEILENQGLYFDESVDGKITTGFFPLSDLHEFIAKITDVPITQNSAQGEPNADYPNGVFLKVLVRMPSVEGGEIAFMDRYPVDLVQSESALNNEYSINYIPEYQETINYGDVTQVCKSAEYIQRTQGESISVPNHTDSRVGAETEYNELSESLTISPVPTDGALRIHFPTDDLANNSPIQTIVYDMRGTQVLMKEHRISKGQFIYLDVSLLPSGTYSINIRDVASGRLSTCRVIVQ